MSAMSELPCDCTADPLERLRYFSRQLLTADDMRTEQAYFREKLRRHNRYLHGWGVVCGCTVEPVDKAQDWTVRVCPGYVVDPQGDDILIDRCVSVDLKLGAIPEPCIVRWPCPTVGEMPGTGSRERKAYIAVRYAECHSRPVKVHPAGCGCDETSCEYSRIRDAFEIKVLWTLPDSHVAAHKDDEAWRDTLLKSPPELLRRLLTMPAPPCPECVSDPWVVLATVLLPAQDAAGAAGSGQAPLQVSYADRRVLLSTQRLQTALLSLT
ncbi:putative membrane protein [Caballeronia cordobensis]|nr:putative membrane protein [Burkholderia sp. RPE67]